MHGDNSEKRITTFSGEWEAVNQVGWVGGTPSRV